MTDALSTRLAKITSVMPGIVYQYQQDVGGQIRFPYISEGAEELFGLSADELMADAAALFHLIHEDDRQPFLDRVTESERTLGKWRLEFRIVKNHRNRWIFGHAQPERLPCGTTLWHGYMADITDRKQLERELQQSRDILSKAQQLGRLGHWQYHPDTGELLCSDIIYEILGLDGASITPTLETMSRLVHPDDMKAVQHKTRSGRQIGSYDIQHRIVRPDGAVRWVHSLADWHRSDSNGEILLGTIRDITEQKELEIRLRRQSVSDELTGLWNRRYFIEQLGREFERYRRHRHQGSLILFDFDHFKLINDRYGHAGGDVVLMQSAEVMQRRLRAIDCLARIGGEEFAVLLPSTPLDDAVVVAESLCRGVAEQVFHTDQHSFSATISCGVASFSDNDRGFEHTMHRADDAMYQAKSDGRNRVCRA
ncbi:MAG: sensor domain-containing diguanylate cyclase [Pseudomonadota bacterium]